MKLRYWIISLLLCFLTFGIVACSDDDNKSEVELPQDAPYELAEYLKDYTYEQLDDFKRGTFVMQQYRVVYTTMDSRKLPVKVSMYMAVPQNPLRVFIDCHATISADAQAPTVGGPAIMASPDLIPLMNAVVIAPDYIGYGESVDHTHLFADVALNGNTVVDGVKVAYDLLYSLDRNVAVDRPSYILGASQGGGVALFAQRIIENEAGLSDYIHLQESYVGSGAYDFGRIFDVWTREWSSNSFPCGALLGVLGMFDECPDEFGDIKVDDLFSEAFIATGIVEAVKSKTYDNSQITTFVVQGLQKAYGDAAFPVPNERIFSPAMMDEKSDVYQRVKSYFSRGNAYMSVGTGMWVPSHRVNMFHSPEDEVVPYVLTEELMAYFDGQGYKNYTFKATSGNHTGSCIAAYTEAIRRILFSY